MNIRRVTAADGMLIRDIRLRALRTDPTSFGSTVEREEAYEDARWNDWAVGDAEGADEATFLAFEADEAVGIVVGARREDEPDVFDVFAMWVAPEVRRKGFGRALLAALEAWMIAGGGLAATLSVTTAADPARSLYESSGYEATGWTQESRHTPGLVEVGLRKALLRAGPREPG